MDVVATPNAMPLSSPQCSALVTAAQRQLIWGLRAVSREVRTWRARAVAIPDPCLRAAALEAIERKRGHVDGAALFWTLPARRDRMLLRTLVAYELLQDYLDGVSERGAGLGAAPACQLYRALTDALDPWRPRCDPYRDWSRREDDAYLAALVETCRLGCAALPGYAAVRPLLLRDAAQATVLALNHRPDATVRDAALRRWAAETFPQDRELRWFELTAAASGWITTHALLALAARRGTTRAEAEATYAAYFPWLAMTLTMLDSYADRAEDRRTGNHSYIAHYETDDAAVQRLCDSVGCAARAVLELPGGERHAVLLGCMVALYLSKDSARAPQARQASARIASAGGTLPTLLVPVLRVWRIRNAQRSYT